MADPRLIEVEMPDGTILTDVPENMSQKEILQRYSRFAAKQNTFTPQEDTVYSPEGIAQITPQTQGAPTGAAGEAAKYMGDIAGAPVRAAMSLAKPVTNVMGWMGMKEPGEVVKQIDTGIKAQGPEAMGIQGPVGSIASLGGDIFSANKILGGLEKIAAPIKTAAPMIKPAIEAIQKSPLTQSVLGGATLGVLGSEGTPLSAIEQGGLGGAAGAVAHGVLKGAGAIADPALAQLKKLQAAGIDTKEFLKNSTMGQVLGGAAQKFENALSALPFGGVAPKIEQGVKGLQGQIAGKQAEIKGGTQEAVTGMKSAFDAAKQKAAQKLEADNAARELRLEGNVAKMGEAIDTKHGGFSERMINEALAPAGKVLPPDAKGTAAIKFAQDVENQLYNKAIPKIGDVRIGDDEVKALNDVLAANKSRLGGETDPLYTRLSGEIDDIVSKAGEGRLLTAQQWHNIFKDLGAEAQKYKGFGVKGTEAEYGHALTQLKNAWMKIIEDTPGADIIKQANQVHSALQVPQTAAGYLKTYTEKGGSFDPKDFLRALKAESSGKKFSAGEAKLQEDALAAYEAMAKDKAGLKLREESFKTQLADLKKQEKAAMGQGNREQAANLAKQRAYLQQQSEQQSKGLTELGKEVAPEPFASYGAKRMAYDVAGAGLLTGGGTILNRVAGISPEIQAMISGGAIGGTRLLYSKPVQDMIKRIAVAERPEFIKQLGAAIREHTPAGAMVSAEEYQKMRQREKPEYTFEEKKD